MSLLGTIANLFKKKQYTYMQPVDDYEPIFIQWGGIPYENDVVRAAVDTIARNAAKLNPKHVRVSDAGIFWMRSNLERLLALEPNPYMSAFDFYYRLVTMRELDNNAFALIVWGDSGEVQQLLPINCSQAEILEDRVLSEL